MSGKRKAPKEEVNLAPLWVVTYGDLVSLLVTFFVLIFTFSSMDVDHYRRVRGALTGATGVMTDTVKSKAATRQQIVPGTAVTDMDGEAERTDRTELAEFENPLNQMVQDPSKFTAEVDMRSNSKGVRITLAGDKLFELGTGKLDPSGRQLLLEVARLFRSESVRLVVEAHTDDRTHTWLRGETAEGLTLRMAKAAAEVLIEETNWSPVRVGISPNGDFSPIAANDSAAGRERNRRLEIMVLPEGERQP